MQHYHQDPNQQGLYITALTVNDLLGALANHLVEEERHSYTSLCLICGLIRDNSAQLG